MAQTEQHNQAEIEAFERELTELRLRGHWQVNREKRDITPMHWKWDDIYTNLVRAGEILDLEYSDRRTLMLITPGLGQTTSNVQMSVQLVKPGEAATAHRHTFAATRFIVQGEGAYTTVDGEPLVLSRGDYVTTPGWSWHDHTNRSDQPIIWLDVHDNPLIGKLHARFNEGYPEPMQPITKPAGATRDLIGIVRPVNRALHASHQPAAYPWADVQPVLDRMAGGEPDPYDGFALDYVNPVTGGHLLPTMGARIQMLTPGLRTQPHRHTSYTVYHVFEGSGVAVVGDKRIEWHKGDVFTVPNWQWHTMESVGSTSAILFSAHDQPVLEAFDLYKEEREEE